MLLIFCEILTFVLGGGTPSRYSAPYSLKDYLLPILEGNQSGIRAARLNN